MLGFVIYLLGIVSGMSVTCLSAILNRVFEDEDKAYEQGFKDGMKIGKSEK